MARPLCSGTSNQTEPKLTNVARASSEQLRLDYEDFLRQRNLALWPQDDPRRAELVARRCATVEAVAVWLREIHARAPHRTVSSQSIPSISSLSGTYPELAANAALVLLGVACALLDRQIVALAAAFVAEGGFTERLYRVRTAHKHRSGAGESATRRRLRPWGRTPGLPVPGVSDPRKTRLLSTEFWAAPILHARQSSPSPGDWPRSIPLR